MDYFEDDDIFIDDEIDLLELVSVDMNSSEQYLIFRGSNDELYGINISKTRELMVYKELNMVRNNQKDSFIVATAQVRDELVTLINFDEWFGNDILDDKEYELIILAGFGGKELGIIIKSVEYIVNISSQGIHDSSVNNLNTNFISKIKLNGEDKLCTIFDCDKMLLDIFEDINTTQDNNIHIDKSILNKDKYILFADDSKYIRKLVTTLIKSLNINYKIFENGLELLDELKTMNQNEIGLIITDLEMPVMDGINLIKNIKTLDSYKDIDIVVHTNMSNDILDKSVIDIGANEVVDKINIPVLSACIKRHFH